MKEFGKLVLVGVVSGLIVLGVSWYCSDLRDSLKIGLEVGDLKEDLHKLQDQVSTLDSKYSALSTQLARIDERTRLTIYDQQKFNQVIQQKKIPQPKAESAQKFLNSTPSRSDAVRYLEMNLGFSPEEAKAVMIEPQNKSVDLKNQNNLKR